MSLWGEFSKQLLPSVSSSALQCARASRASLIPPAPQNQLISVSPNSTFLWVLLFLAKLWVSCHSTIPPLSFFETGSQMVRTMTMQPRMNLTSVSQVSCFYLLNTRMTGRHNHAWFNVVLGSSPGLCAHWARTPPAELHPQLQCPKVHS